MPRKRPTIKEIQRMDSESMGWCTECRDFTTGCCEPDARDYECEACGENTVMGAMEALIEGII